MSLPSSSMPSLSPSIKCNLSLSSRYNPSQSGRRSPSWSCQSSTYDKVYKEDDIKVYTAIEFSNITVGDLADEKSALANFTVRKLEHHKEAWSHSYWEHEFLVAEIYHPNNSAEISHVLLIDRENRPSQPDIVHVIPMNASTSLPHILSRIGYHSYNLGRSCEFDSPHSVAELASILAEKSQAGGNYSSRDKNCYWYANDVFNYCSDTYSGKTTRGPYYNDLGNYRGGPPQNALTKGVLEFVRYGSFTAFGAGIAAASLPFVVGGITIACASFLANSALVSQADPLRS